jgi:iron complex outermembrane receptor protein
METPQAEPSLKFVFSPSLAQTFWGSVSRAVRTPSRYDTNLSIAFDLFLHPSGLLVFPIANGSPSFQPETMTAWEAGHRWQQGRFSTDVALFLNRYGQLRTVEPGQTELRFSPVPHMLSSLYYANEGSGTTYGAELSAYLDLLPSLRLQAVYSYLVMNLETTPGSSDPTINVLRAEAPRHLGKITAFWNVSRNITIDSTVRGVTRRESVNKQVWADAALLPGYVSVGSRIGWKLTGGLEAALAVDNLLNRRHQEFQSVVDWTGREAEYLGRRVQVDLTWRF